MSQPELIERLKGHRIVGTMPDDEIAWVAAHGRLQQMRVGDVLASPALGPIEEMFILLSGRFSYHAERGAGLRKVMEWQAGDVSGLLPYSRLTMPPPGESRVDEDAEVLLVHRDDFPEMIRECPVLTRNLVWTMLDRARRFREHDLETEKLVSLGRLAAGLAHELHNPTSAALRSAKLLIPLLQDADSAARDLGASGITADQFAAIEALRDGCHTASTQQIRSPLDQARHEESISDWLASRGLRVANEDSLADAPITLPMLDALAGSVDGAVLEPALRWLAAGCALFSLGAELEHAAARTSELVTAVKGFTQMDRAATLQLVDVENSLRQTLVVLRSKARARSGEVRIVAEPELPRVLAVPGELNQIWMNLIDNALDAIEEGGSVAISIARGGNFLVVRIVDNGSGIPPDVQEHVFEPFFTTKPVGRGTGLGLDIVRRLVDRQNGSVELSSEPGHTEFRVFLPIPNDSDQDAAT